jgi:DNA-binding response OmpR family regulator
MTPKARILVVEDQALTAAMVVEALSDTYEAISVRTVLDAVEQLLIAKTHLVLLDCVLPGGTMWQVLLEADRQKVPVVLMSGDPGEMREIAGGPRPHLLKPFSIAALLGMIDAQIAQAATADKLRSRTNTDFT